MVRALIVAASAPCYRRIAPNTVMASLVVGFLESSFLKVLVISAISVLIGDFQMAMHSQVCRSKVQREELSRSTNQRKAQLISSGAYCFGKKSDIAVLYCPCGCINPRYTYMLRAVFEMAFMRSSLTEHLDRTASRGDHSSMTDSCDQDYTEAILPQLSCISPYSPHRIVIHHHCLTFIGPECDLPTPSCSIRRSFQYICNSIIRWFAIELLIPNACIALTRECLWNLYIKQLAICPRLDINAN